MRCGNSQVPVYLRLALLAGAIALSGFAGAQSSVSTGDLQRCAQIASGVERLGCFDLLTRELTQGAATPSRVAETSAEPEPDTVAAIDAFGAERLTEDATGAPEEIQSRLVGEFTGWRRDTLFRLENGQVWRQVGPGRLVFKATAPLVTIRRGAFNSYRLGVEGVNTTVTVRRIQ